MKKSIFSIMLWSLVALVAPVMSMAQMPQPQPLPMDSAIRVGQLPNGLTYFIRQNAYPKGQADFFIAQKVGSVLEEDNQRGLAHFLEHMAFNGTKNSPVISCVTGWHQKVSCLAEISMPIRASMRQCTTFHQSPSLTIT